MKAVGIICEYNPFHNGHIYHIQKVKEKFPDSILVLVLNGYFLERGEISCISKQDKVKLALNYGIDLVLELPVVFGTQSADIFAERALEILNSLQVSDVVFGSECDDIQKITFYAKQQFHPTFSNAVQEYLLKGYNYPSALAKALGEEKIIPPNDLLGISYAKAIIKNHWNIILHTIKRSNDYHDITSNNSIISASNIRNKILLQEDISPFVPFEILKKIKKVDWDKFWKLLQFRILTDSDLSIYMTVDEGIEHRLKKCVLKASTLSEFVEMIKTKRYTYNRIHRMLIHILLGFTKEMNQHLTLDYIRILGFRNTGKKYLNKIKKKLDIPFQDLHSQIYQMEEIAAYLYDEITNSQEHSFELKHRPIKEL